MNKAQGDNETGCLITVDGRCIHKLWCRPVVVKTRGYPRKQHIPAHNGFADADNLDHVRKVLFKAFHQGYIGLIGRIEIPAFGKVFLLKIFPGLHVQVEVHIPRMLPNGIRDVLVKEIPEPFGVGISKDLFVIHMINPDTGIQILQCVLPRFLKRKIHLVSPVQVMSGIMRGRRLLRYCLQRDQYYLRKE